MTRDYTPEEQKMINKWLKKYKPKVKEAVEYTDGYTGCKMQGKKED